MKSKLYISASDVKCIRNAVSRNLPVAVAVIGITLMRLVIRVLFVADSVIILCDICMQGIEKKPCKN